MLVFGREVITSCRPIQVGGRASGNGHDAIAGRELRFERSSRTSRHVAAALQDRFRRALCDKDGLSRRVPDKYRNQAALMIEWEYREPVIATRSGPHCG